MPTELPTPGDRPRPINPGTNKEPESAVETLVDKLIDRPAQPDAVNPLPEETTKVPVR